MRTAVVALVSAALLSTACAKRDSPKAICKHLQTLLTGVDHTPREILDEMKEYQKSCRESVEYKSQHPRFAEYVDCVYAIDSHDKLFSECNRIVSKWAD